MINWIFMNLTDKIIQFQLSHKNIIVLNNILNNQISYVLPPSADRPA
jgi:hypothetical protein